MKWNRRLLPLSSALALAVTLVQTGSVAVAAPVAPPDTATTTRAAAVSPVAVVAPIAANGRTCTIWGNSKKNKLIGTSGDDVICGLGGNDTIDGRGGNDVIDGGPGNDSLKGGTGNDILIGGAGNDRIDGQSGQDTASYVDSKPSVKVTLASHKKQKTGKGSDTLIGIENLSGGAGHDTLTGDSHANVIDGGRGNDKLYGGSGNDTLIGGAGNDRMDGQSGTDRVSYADVRVASASGLVVAADASAAGVTVSLNTTKAQNTGNGVDTLLSDEGVIGSVGDDTLIGNSGANVIAGGGGNDALSGGAGNDTLTGDAGADTLTGADGNDTLDGGLNPDTLDGGPGANVCTFTAEDSVAPNCDGTAPDILSISVSSDSVDTTSSSQTIEVTVRVTDDLSGVWDSYIWFTNVTATGHSGATQTGLWVFPSSNPWSTLVSGDERDGIYTGTLHVPAGSEPGTWVASADLNDRVGNRRIYSTDELAKRGIGASFTQTGAATDPTARPKMVGLEFSTTSVDTSAASQDIVVSVHATSQRGIQSMELNFEGPAGSGGGQGQPLNLQIAASDLVSGTSTDGVYQTTLTVPRYSAQGFWSLEMVGLLDTAQHGASYVNLKSLGFVSGFRQTGAGDAVTPSLVSLAFDPPTVDASAADQTITVTARVTDNLAGFKIGSAIFHSTALSDQQIISYFSPANLTSGSGVNGTYQWRIVVPRYAASGKWSVDVSLGDNVGNVGRLNAAAIEATGITAGFTVK